MSELIKIVGYGCVLVCVALLAVGVFLFYLIKRIVVKDEELED